ncbi:DUF4091 domain-containing protein [Spiroplasma endosymbiont of Stenodema calcarata]|uniref:DUF4091 domain-containing protein n=1 Tax=Spiroplasma endosymbiont of Stenodema calcarata TaxID=3139328 RepID=UPI003CCB5052
MQQVSFKKIIQILLVFVLVPPFVMMVVSCSRLWAGGSGSGGHGQYDNQFNFQYGCGNNKNLLPDDNPYFHTFFGDSKFTYSAYNEDKNGNPIFYGNRQDVLKCSNDNPMLTSWKNQHLNTQLILLNTKDITMYHDLEVSITNDNNDPNIISDAVFLTYIKAFPNAAKSDRYIYPDVQYMPDALGEKTLAEINYDVQPIWISIFVGPQAKTGIQNFTVNLKFTFDEQRVEHITSKFSVNIKNYLLETDDSNKPLSERFGFSATSFPSNAMKYIDTGNNKVSKNASLETVLSGEKEGPFDNNLPWYLSAKMRPYLLTHLKDLKKSNTFYLYGPGWNYQLIQWSGKLNKPGWTDEEYENYLKSKDLNAVLNDPNWEWEFDFNAFDEYLKVAAQLGYTEFMFSAMEPGAFSFFYLKNGAQKGPQRKFNVDLVDSRTGLPGKNFDAYLNAVHGKFIKALSNHWNSLRNKPEYLTPNGQQISLYESFDELADQTNELTMKNVAQNDRYGVIKSSVFAGWRFKYNPFDENDIQNIFLNKYNQIILQYREIVEKFNNINIYKLRSNIIWRKSFGNSTMIYTSWNNFPAAYIQSDNSEQIWGPLMAYKLGANGYVRWSFDLYRDDYYATKEMNGEFESGDDNLVYFGNINGPRYSVRYKNYIDGMEVVHKMMTLMKLYPDKKYDLNRALNAIGFPATTRDNYYKWYPNQFTLDDVVFEQPGLNYYKTIGQQVYELFMYVNSL